MKIGTEYTPEGTIYLVDDLADGRSDLELLLEPYFDIIFKEALNGWHRMEED